MTSEEIATEIIYMVSKRLMGVTLTPYLALRIIGHVVHEVGLCVKPEIKESK